jgi:hypothetical protein
MTEMCLQGTNRESSFERGSLLQFLPSIIMPHAAPNTTEQQSGLSMVARLMSGRRTVHYCGSVAIVSLFSPCPHLMTAKGFSVFLAGSGKSILWYAV